MERPESASPVKARQEKEVVAYDLDGDAAQAGLAGVVQAVVVGVAVNDAGDALAVPVLAVSRPKSSPPSGPPDCVQEAGRV